jgi:hypothetical protein
VLLAGRHQDETWTEAEGPEQGQVVGLVGENITTVIAAVGRVKG